MYINPEITIANIIASISIIISFILAFFTYGQWKDKSKIARADYMNSLIEKLYNDETIAKTLYQFDYNSSWYSMGFHGNEQKELAVDKTLAFLSFICYLRQNDVLTEKEFSYFEYKIRRVISDSQMQDYFYNLYHFSRKHHTDFTYKYLYDYGNEHGLFDDDFKDKESYKRRDKYHKNINF